MIYPLLPINQQAFERVQRALKKQVYCSSLDEFITLYNMGQLDRNNTIIREIVNTMLNAFKNLTIHNRKFMIESPGETACKNSIILLKQWLVIIQIKRLASILLEEDYPIDTKIVFNQECNGTPYIEITQDGETVLTKHWSATKVITHLQELATNLFTSNILRDYDDEDSCCFLLEDVLDFDDSFLVKLEQELLQHSFVDQEYLQ